ncbi:hypothetical protein LXL04_003118 [Taraxacum kok-saghyz]
MLPNPSSKISSIFAEGSMRNAVSRSVEGGMVLVGFSQRERVVHKMGWGSRNRLLCGLTDVLCSFAEHASAKWSFYCEMDFTEAILCEIGVKNPANPEKITGGFPKIDAVDSSIIASDLPQAASETFSRINAISIYPPVRDPSALILHSHHKQTRNRGATTDPISQKTPGFVFLVVKHLTLASLTLPWFDLPQNHSSSDLPQISVYHSRRLRSFEYLIEDSDLFFEGALTTRVDMVQISPWMMSRHPLFENAKNKSGPLCLCRIICDYLYISNFCLKNAQIPEIFLKFCQIFLS